MGCCVVATGLGGVRVVGSRFTSLITPGSSYRQILIYGNEKSSRLQVNSSVGDSASHTLFFRSRMIR